MKLLNISAGKVQAVRIGEETVRTAYVKTPQPGPWVIDENGVAGDQRAVHPDKLYAFARSGYDHWGRYLGIDPGTWGDGFFGENLTLDMFDDNQVHVGDVYRLGDEVRLVVTGARNPCIKLSWRLNQPRSFQKIFARSRHTGAYFGVRQAGTVRPGDQLERIVHDPSMPTIADVSDYVISHGPLPLAPLRRLLAFDGLSLTNRLLLGAKLDAAERAASAVDGSWLGWRPFTITRIVEETADIRSLYLRADDEKPLCQPRPGQFVSVRLGGARRDAIIRTWSLSAFAHDMSDYRISVRRQTGPGSSWVHRAVEGDQVELRSPAGDFHLDMGGFRPVVLIAAGIGITPLLAMLQAHLARPGAAPVYLIYGARTPQETAFMAEIEALARQYAILRVTYIFSRAGMEGQPGGRITPERVIAALADLHIMIQGHRRADLPWYESDMYICGPGEFCQELRSSFIERGGNPDHIFSELFTAQQAGATEMETAEVIFQAAGTSLTWEADSGLTLLELAEQAGIIVPSDCRAGACLSCRTKVLAGTTTADTGDDHVLLCIGRPGTATLVLDR